MRSFGHARALVWALAVLLAGAAFLDAQRTYRDIELPPPALLPEPVDGDQPAELYLARLAYTDLYAGELLSERPWQIDSPAAERHFLQGVRRLSNIDASPKELYLRATDDNVFDYPVLYAVEASYWDLTTDEVERLREYLLRGGFLILDDFHGPQEWARFLVGMQQVFPDRPIRDIPPEDEIFHVLYDLEPGEQIPGVQMLYTGNPAEQGGVTPHWRGIYDDDGRLMVMINFNMDLGDAWEHADWPEYPERYTAMAYRMALNYIIYSMTH